MRYYKEIIEKIEVAFEQKDSREIFLLAHEAAGYHIEKTSDHIFGRFHNAISEIMGQNSKVLGSLIFHSGSMAGAVVNDYFDAYEVISQIKSICSTVQGAKMSIIPTASYSDQVKIHTAQAV